MIKLIAETAWHHEGNVDFLKKLVESVCKETDVNIVKLHITLDLDEYMSSNHNSYKTLKKWMIPEDKWEEIVGIVRKYNKELLLLLNDSRAIEFANKFSPEYVEIHSVALNVPRLQKGLIDTFGCNTDVFIGVGGCTLEEIDQAVSSLQKFDPILMFGFQNYPTEYQSINLAKIQKIQGIYSKARYGYADHCGWDEPHNELITLLVASNLMQFVEKHVTLYPGVERCDFSAAISIDQFNALSEKLKILDRVLSDGQIGLNSGEASYSIYGPMKMAAISRVNAEAGETLGQQDVDFKRCAATSDVSQVELFSLIEKPLRKPVSKGVVLQKGHFV